MVNAIMGRFPGRRRGRFGSKTLQTVRKRSTTLYPTYLQRNTNAHKHTHSHTHKGRQRHPPEDAHLRVTRVTTNRTSERFGGRTAVCRSPLCREVSLWVSSTSSLKNQTRISPFHSLGSKNFQRKFSGQRKTCVSKPSTGFLTGLTGSEEAVTALCSPPTTANVHTYFRTHQGP